MKIVCDNSDFKRWTEKVQKISKSAYPLAVRGTLNTLAFKTAEIAKKEVLPKNFHLRNKYIQKTVQYSKCANTFDVEKMTAITGQVAKFVGKQTDQLKKQELGGTDKPRKKYLKTGLPAARTGGTIAKKIKANATMSRIESAGLQTAKGINKLSGNSRQQTKQIISTTIRTKKKYAMFTTMAGNKVIARVTSKSTRRKGAKPKANIEVLYKLQTSRSNKPRPWLKPSADKAEKEFETEFIAQAQRQYDRVMRKR